MNCSDESICFWDASSSSPSSSATWSGGGASRRTSSCSMQMLEQINSGSDESFGISARSLPPWVQIAVAGSQCKLAKVELHSFSAKSKSQTQLNPVTRPPASFTHETQRRQVGLWSWLHIDAIELTIVGKCICFIRGLLAKGPLSSSISALGGGATSDCKSKSPALKDQACWCLGASI